MNESALLLLNLQNDFMPDGALAIETANEIIPIANQLMHQFSFVVAVKKWYPQDHISFAQRHPRKAVGETITINGKVQELWPEHCLQETVGAELVADLDLSGIDHILCKGSHRLRAGYSAFFENRNHLATGLHTLLKFNQIKDIYILGFSLEHEVMRTALDAMQLGYQTKVIIDACRSGLPNLANSKATYQELSRQGVYLVNSSEFNVMPRQLFFEFDQE